MGFRCRQGGSPALASPVLLVLVVGSVWAAGKRLAFANDPVNLLAVDAGANRAKGDGDVATRNPPSGTGVVLYDFFADGVQVGSGYSFMVDRGAAVITPVGATSVTASAWTTSGIGDPPLLGYQIGETSANCM